MCQPSKLLFVPGSSFNTRLCIFSCSHLVVNMQLILTPPSHVNYILRFYFYEREETPGSGRVFVWSGKSQSGICLVGELSIGNVSVGEVPVGEVPVGDVFGYPLVSHNTQPCSADSSNLRLKYGLNSSVSQTSRHPFKTNERTLDKSGSFPVSC